MTRARGRLVALAAVTALVMTACGTQAASQAPTARLGPAPQDTDGANDPQDTAGATAPQGRGGDASGPPEFREAPARDVTTEAAAPTAAAQPPGAPVPPPPAPPVDVAAYTVPEVVDVAYAQRVMDALDSIDGQAARAVRVDGGLGVDFFRLTGDLHTEAAAARVIANWQERVLAGLPGVPDEPGPPVTTVEEIVEPGPDCIVLRARRDYTGYNGVPAAQHTVGLVRTDAEPDPERNPTPYRINDDAVTLEDPCA